MSRYHVIIVDDEKPNLDSLERVLKSDGASVEAFLNPQDAINGLKKGFVDVLITDLRMGTWNGLELLETIKHLDSSIEVILITAYGTVEVAVDAMKKGAYDFITKPLQRLQVLKVVHKALEKRKLVNENSELKEVLSLGSMGHREIVGESLALASAIEVAGQAANSRANVLIEGESGTGKGILAEYIHRMSQTKGALVKINCTAIPETLLEAELFGYEAGAFTGANKRKPGRIELANGGTLFLDEIGIAPLTLQAKLLRFLQDGEFERLGSNITQKVDTRVISATNANMKEAIETGRIREDLYYRLNVIHIQMPPLRDRIQDIPLLAKRFMDDAGRKNAREVPRLESEVLECLKGYSWPGNIRELQNLMERLVVLDRDGVITVEDLPREVGGAPRDKAITVPIGMSLRKVECLLMDETLKLTKGDKRLAAKILGVHPRTIYRYLESLAKSEIPFLAPST